MDLKLDPVAGDLDLSKGTPALVDGKDAIAQKIAIRLRFFKGEWFLDKRLGVPYFQQIFVKGTRLAVIAALLRKAISTTPGVVSVPVFSVSLDSRTRALTTSFTVTTDLGDIDFSDLFIVETSR